MVKLARFIDKYWGSFLCVLFGVIDKIFFRKSEEIDHTYKEKSTRKEKSFNILIIKLWAIGDSVNTLPLIKAIKNKYSTSKLTVLATERNKDVYSDNNYVDIVLLFKLKNIPVLFQKIKKFDLVFDLEPYLNISALIAFFLGRHRIGFANQTRSMLYNQTIQFRKDQHVIKTYLQMAELVGASYDKNTSVELKVPEKDKFFVEKYLTKNEIEKGKFLVGISPGTAESVKSRMWNKERFAQLADRIIEKYKASILFIGSPQENQLIREIQSMMKHSSCSLNTAGELTLKQVFYLIKKCKIFISNDTGPMHIAAAQGCEVIGLFGPNTPKIWAPYGKNNLTIYKKIECSPCIINDKGIMPDCFNKEYGKCMKKISVNDVLKAFEKLYAQRNEK